MVFLVPPVLVLINTGLGWSEAMSMLLCKIRYSSLSMMMVLVRKASFYRPLLAGIGRVSACLLLRRHLSFSSYFQVDFVFQIDGLNTPYFVHLIVLPSSDL